MNVSNKAFPYFQGTTTTTSTPAPTLWPAAAAQASPPRFRHQPDECEEAALGAGGELWGNNLGPGEGLTPTWVWSLRVKLTTVCLLRPINTVNNQWTCEFSHLGCDCSHSYICEGPTHALCCVSDESLDSLFVNRKHDGSHLLILTKVFCLTVTTLSDRIKLNLYINSCFLVLEPSARLQRVTPSVLVFV